MIRNVVVTPGVNVKLLPKFKGLYVVKVLDYDRYAIEDVPGFQLTHRSFSKVFSSVRMKL